MMSKRMPKDPLDAVFYSVIKKDSVLETFNTEITKFREMRIDSLNDYNKFNRESEYYYDTALGTANTITDSVLKESILQMLALSRQRYTKKIQKLTQTVNSIAKHDTSIQNYYSALKIAATLPVIEKYQNNNLSKFKSLERIDSAAAALDAKTKAMAEAHIKKLKK